MYGSRSWKITIQQKEEKERKALLLFLLSKRFLLFPIFFCRGKKFFFLLLTFFLCFSPPIQVKEEVAASFFSCAGRLFKKAAVCLVQSDVRTRNQVHQSIHPSIHLHTGEGSTITTTPSHTPPPPLTLAPLPPPPPPIRWRIGIFYASSPSPFSFLSFSSLSHIKQLLLLSPETFLLFASLLCHRPSPLQGCQVGIFRAMFFKRKKCLFFNIFAPKIGNKSFFFFWLSGLLSHFSCTTVWAFFPNWQPCPSPPPPPPPLFSLVTPSPSPSSFLFRAGSQWTNSLLLPYNFLPQFCLFSGGKKSEKNFPLLLLLLCTVEVRRQFFGPLTILINLTLNSWRNLRGEGGTGGFFWKGGRRGHPPTPFFVRKKSSGQKKLGSLSSLKTFFLKGALFPTCPDNKQIFFFSVWYGMVWYI